MKYSDIDSFYSSLPFEPTNAQKRAVSECARDMNGEYPMNRLVQGDVGSGKTAVEYRDNLGRSNVGRTKTVATANDERTVLHVVECALNVEIQRLTLSSRLLSAVENGNALAALWYGSDKVLYRERTIEVNADHTNLLALLEQMVDSLAGSLGGRTHEDDNVLSILSTIVVRPGLNGRPSAPQRAARTAQP